MRALAGIIAALLLVVAAPAANAQDAEISTYLAAGAAYFGAPAAQVEQRVEQVPGDANAWAGAVENGFRDGTPFIVLDPDWYPYRPGVPRAYWEAQMCTIVAHEYGHLIGRAHEPSGLMAVPVPINVVPGCPTYHEDDVLWRAARARARKPRTARQRARLRALRSHRLGQGYSRGAPPRGARHAGP